MKIEEETNHQNVVKLWLVEAGWWRNWLIDLRVPRRVRGASHHCVSVGPGN